MNTTQEVITLLADVLGLGDRRALLGPESHLMGSIPELDSMGVVNLLTALEEHFGIVVNDDEINNATFQTVASLSAFVGQKLGR